MLAESDKNMIKNIYDVSEVSPSQQDHVHNCKLTGNASEEDTCLMSIFSERLKVPAKAGPTPVLPSRSLRMTGLTIECTLV